MLVIALAVGLPLGVAAGRWAWTVVAEQLGTAAEPVTPLAVVLLTIPPRGCSSPTSWPRCRHACRIPPEAGGRPAQRIASPSGLATCCLVGMQMWHMRIGRDTEAVVGKTLDRAVMRRVWRFARPYRRMLWRFLATIVLTSLVGILPPLVFKRIIDDAIPQARPRPWSTASPCCRSAWRSREAGLRARRALVLGPHRRGPDLRPAHRAVRPRAAPCRSPSSPAPRPAR